jgi:hypothetical protein
MPAGQYRTSTSGSRENESQKANCSYRTHSGTRRFGVRPRRFPSMNACTRNALPGSSPRSCCWNWRPGWSWSQSGRTMWARPQRGQTSLCLWSSGYLPPLFKSLYMACWRTVSRPQPTAGWCPGIGSGQRRGADVRSCCSFPLAQHEREQVAPPTEPDRLSEE